jgi:hypothetical protein
MTKLILFSDLDAFFVESWGETPWLENIETFSLPSDRGDQFRFKGETEWRRAPYAVYCRLEDGLTELRPDLHEEFLEGLVIEEREI